jgi:hypothetical protein
MVAVIPQGNPCHDPATPQVDSIAEPAAGLDTPSLGSASLNTKSDASEYDTPATSVRDSTSETISLH